MSPDINPIENVWHLLKMLLQKKKIGNYRSLVAAINREWKALPKELAGRLSATMKNRVSEVIDRNEDFILH